MEFFPETNVSENEAELIAQGLLAVARADGQLHARELAMVQAFYGEIVGGTGTAVAGLERGADIPAKILADGLTRAPVAMLFVKTALLCAYADGAYGPKERAKIEEYATALGIEPAALEELHQSVKEYLVAQLTNVKNVDAVLEVSKKLDM
jgi:tellurite resistance protein